MKKLLILGVVVAVVGIVVGFDVTSLGNYEFGFSLPGIEGNYGLIEIDK